MSMQQPFKFRHLDSIVGGFVIAAVMIVVIALALIGSAKQWFVRKQTVEAMTPPAAGADAEFYEELAESLKPGTPVELAGQVVGTVTFSDAKGGVLHLKLSLAERALDQLYQGLPGPQGRSGEAKVVIKAPLAAFMGQPNVVLKPGSEGEQGWLKDSWHENQALTIIPPSDSAALAKKVLLAVEANLGPMMAAITSLVTESRDLVKEIREQRLPQQAGELVAGLRERQVPQRLDALLARGEQIAASAEAIAADARRLSAGVAAGQGVAGKVLTDAKLGEDLARIAADLRAIIAELRTAAPAAPGLVEGASTLLDEVQRLVDGLNRHWLLKGYTEPGDGGRIEPTGIVTPGPEAKP